MQRLCIATLLALSAGAACAESGNDNEPREQHQIAQSGDLLQIAVPLAGFGLTFLLHDHASGGTSLGFDVDTALHMDGSPRHDFALAGLRTELATAALKYGVDEQRPNGGSHSFPSGHTAAAFMGAEFIRKEYGWAWGTPAYLAAAYVGWSRIETQNHWPHDVYAGAAIGVLSNHDWNEIRVPFGALSVGAGLIAPNPAPAPGFAEMDGYDATPAALASGLSLLLKFGGPR